MGEIGRGRSVEDYLREIERHRWELEHRVNQIADHLSVAKKTEPPRDSESRGGGGERAEPLVDPERDRRRNAVEASANPGEVQQSEEAIAEFLSRLPSPNDPEDAGRVPRIFHFVFGFKDSGDLPYYGFMAIKSALHFNPGWTAYFHCMHEPAGPNWDRIKHAVNVVKLRDFTHFMTARLHHYAHKADVIRLLVINRVGGVYLDVDTITQKSFDDLRDVQFAMGVQAAGPNSSSGLCNAVLIGQPGAEFSTRWIEQYDYFRSKGRDDLWDYHSVKYPVIMMSRAPESITVLGYRAFFYPLWTTIEQQLFTDRGKERFDGHFDVAYCFHLWNGGTGAFLETLDDDFVRKSHSIYAEIARKVEGLSN